ncbi:MAG TPA: CDP-alcohol phosphatidyltransferase family protein [Candidatus Acidoferrum sp.]|nr:CDP-alcohol phosphatidyltransferase family protein [Candidatus Acidoferrum sp.]
MQGRIWTVPNQITLLRLGFLPFFLILISYEHYRWALALLVLAGLSDGIDGLLARKLNQRSSLGAYLDPIADKLLLSSSFVILAMEKKIAWWLTIIVLSRDILILVVGAVIILIFGYRPFPPSILGKLTTMFQIILVFTVVLSASYPSLPLAGINEVLIYVVATLAIISGFHYSVSIARRLSSPAQPNS